MIYLIDYENVSHLGLIGVDKLHKEDSVYIFHNSALKTIPFMTCKALSTSLAEITYIETSKVAKNYLDFQLSTHLGYLFGQGKKENIYIISNDTGYDSVIDYWKARNLCVKRKSVVSEKAKNKLLQSNIPENIAKKKKKKKKTKIKPLSEACKDNIRKAIKPLNLPLNDYTIIYNLFLAAKNKGDFHNKLVIQFTNEKGLILYKALKGIYLKHFTNEL